jgi:hypothetical protein
MSCFRKFDHVERLGHSETIGILDGTVYVYPKLDGTNASTWVGDDGIIRAGSRNREISVTDDNHGFAKWLHGDDSAARTLREFLHNNPQLIVYGEWLVPHTVKDYEADAWRQFYAFDVFDTETGAYRSASARTELDGFFIPPIAILQNPTRAEVEALLEKATFLMDPSKGPGEGIVIKNYGWKNRFGRQPWGKIVRAEFVAKMTGKVKAPPAARATETQMAEEAVTKALVEKERSKIVAELAAAQLEPDAAPEEFQRLAERERGRIIPATLGRVWHCVVHEELWEVLKRHKNPTIDFKALHRSVLDRARAFLVGGGS